MEAAIARSALGKDLSTSHGLDGALGGCSWDSGSLGDEVVVGARNFKGEEIAENAKLNGSETGKEVVGIGGGIKTPLDRLRRTD